MIKNLIVNGCSFTTDQPHPSWAKFLTQNYDIQLYQNIAMMAAGNYYICTSTINLLEEKKLNPAETMIIIMWSGTGRKDLNISGEWWYYLKDSYPIGCNQDDKNYYIFSAGLTSSWKTNKTAKQIFDWSYKLSDPKILCLDSLLNFINLENYLKVHGYQYKFTSFLNFWNPQVESHHQTGDYSIGYFCKDLPIYQNYNFSHWFFINDQFDGLSEFAENMNELNATGHPTVIAHKKFAKEIVLPLMKF